MNLRNVVRHSAFPFALLGALAFVLCLNLAVAVAHNHYENKVYDRNGWSEVADSSGGTFSWGIDPDFPTNNDQGYNIRDAMRDGMDAWALVRSGHVNRGYAHETTSYSSADYQYIECEGENLCYGSNVKQLHDGVSVCSSNHWGLDGHGPICYAYSKLDPSWDGITETRFKGAIAHEMGHALGLQHPSWTACNTIMNGCWVSRDTPGPADEKSLDRIYGLPHRPQATVISGANIRGSALDYSSYDTHYRFELWKKPTGSSTWTHVHGNTATAPSGHGQTVSYTEDVWDQGCGYFSYGIWAVNEYPDDTVTDQFGGYSNQIYVCETP